MILCKVRRAASRGYGRGGFAETDFAKEVEEQLAMHEVEVGLRRVREDASQSHFPRANHCHVILLLVVQPSQSEAFSEAGGVG